MEYIVRADFYPNGEIIPLGITDCHGNSIKDIQELSDNLFHIQSKMSYEYYSLAEALFK